MWLITTKNNLSQRYVLSGNKEYIVGRNDADIILLEKSISRHHAKLKVDPLSGCLTLTDISRFGTFLNEQPVGKSGPVSISSGSEITFGAQPGITVIVECHILSALLSSVTPSLRGTLRSQLQQLGACLLRDWTSACNLLIMSKLIVTHKVLCALLSGVPIVHPGYITALLDACNRQPFMEPEKALFLPPIEENEFSEADAHRFLAKKDRRDIFNDKAFFFLTESKMQRYQYLLGLTNARVELLKLPNINKEDVANLFHEIQPVNLCLLYESPTPTTQYHQSVYAVCQRFGIRPIIDQEIAFAIIYNSCDVYCNTQAPCENRILSQSGIPKDQCFNLNPLWQNTGSTDVSKRISIKRSREEEDERDEQNQRCKITKHQTRMISKLPPSNISFKQLLTGTVTKPKVLVPDTEAACFSSIILADSLQEDEETESKVINASTPVVVPIDDISLDPPLQLSKKHRLSQFTDGSSLRPKRPLTKPDSNDLDKDVLSAFDSMPSLSSLRRNKRILQLSSPQLEPVVKPDPTVAPEPSQENIPPSDEKCEDYSTDPEGSTVLVTAVCSQLPSSKYIKSSPSPPPPPPPPPPPQLTTSLGDGGGFISKATRQRQAPTDEPRANTKIKFTKLCHEYACNQHSTASISPITSTQHFFELGTVNFKCFRKVWPFSDLKGNPRQPAFDRAAPIPIIPFLPGKKTDIAAVSWFAESSNVSSEDALNKAKIDRLFNELTALSTVKRR